MQHLCGPATGYLLNYCPITDILGVEKGFRTDAVDGGNPYVHLERVQEGQVTFRRPPPSVSVNDDGLLRVEAVEDLENF
jgi:hypothetical protein